VQCRPGTEGSDCGGGTPRCSPASLSCVQCQPGTEGSDCGGSTPACHEEQCVECNPATEAANCGAYSCDRTTHECTTVPRGSQLSCESCQSDSECATGLGCVEHVYGQGASAVSLGRFCFFKKSTNGCGNTDVARRPYSQEVPTTSVDGQQTTYCLPITSCAALADAFDPVSGAESCTSNEDCGVDTVDDGYCRDIGVGDKRCTYSCNYDYHCPQSGFTTCSGMPGVCIP
jgi:hypothetical protein